MVDELHLMLRIMDILIRNLIWYAAMEDSQNVICTSTGYVDLLVEKVKECGVTFRVCYIILIQLIAFTTSLLM